MTLAQTSLLAYRTLTKLGDKQEQVFEAIKEMGKASNEQIADYLGWPINRVTGRTNELANFDLVKVDGLTIGKSGKSAKTWVVVDLNDRKLREVAKEPLIAVSWLNDTEECSV
jgi:hypothetical protein